MRRNALVLWAIGILGIAVIGGCRSQEGDSSRAANPPAASRQPPSEGSDLIIPPGLLDHAGLKTVWQQKLPLKKGERFAAVTLLGDRLYLRSDRNYLWSLDRTKGDVVFSRSIAPQGIPVLGLAAYEDTLISVVGNQLVEFDVNSGTERRVSDLELSIIAPPVRNSQFFYISAADRRLHALRARDLVQIFEVAIENESLMTTVVADESLVVIGTHAGDLVAIMPDAPKRLWRFKATEAVAGPVIPDGNSFYFASTDTHVYRVDMMDATTANMVWRFQTEAVLDRPPRVTKDFVYQYAIGRGLTAIAKQTGQAVWSLPGGVDLLAEAGNKAYVITKSRTLAVMDTATGKELFSVNFTPVTDHAANTTDARIYLTDETGRIACLEPTP